jgi:phosphoribosylamine--glycine ligase
MLATDQGTLDQQSIALTSEAALCVVLASKGYPGDYEKGTVIANLEELDTLQNVITFHAGTHKNAHDEFVANGGRVLGITALGNSVTEAQNLAYDAVDKIDWKEGFCRRDIGWRAVKREKENAA